MSTTDRPPVTTSPLSTADALELFDGLGAVDVGEMTGTWAGEEFPTGHPMDGLLAATGWYGKQFVDAETVHPLLFHTADRRAVFPVDPARVPVGVSVPTGPGWSYHRLITAAAPLLRTRRPRARLRAMTHRGVTTATMIYDAKPIQDVFRRLDPDTVLGLMDLRDSAPYFFLLRRDPGTVVRA